MKPHASNPGPRLRPVLLQREVELRALLHGILIANSEPPGGQDGVTDFKDIAAEQSRDVVDEAQADHAALELEQVMAAQHRIDDGTYGKCLECGEAIDERRLVAMPAAAYCVACQAIHEHTRPR